MLRTPANLTCQRQAKIGEFRAVTAELGRVIDRLHASTVTYHNRLAVVRGKTVMLGAQASRLGSIIDEYLDGRLSRAA